MSQPGNPDDLKDILVFLATVGVAAPLFRKIKLSPALGFLLAGILLGPFGLGQFAHDIPLISMFTLTDPKKAHVLGELGVVFLMFTIGLELSFERLKAMRRQVFGLGMAQVIVSALLLGGFLYFASEQSPAASIAAALALCLSSTALVLPVLAENRKLSTPVGRNAFAILLAQDLAVAPLLISVSVLASMKAGQAETLNLHSILSGLLSLAPSAIGLGLLVVLGRRFLRPMFRQAAIEKSPETFMAASLLVVMGAGLAAHMAGLSMTLGAFVAGLLLAETEYRREIEVTLAPFKGLLLGLFFLSVGLELNFDVIIRAPDRVVGLAILLIFIKALAILCVARPFGLKGKTALETAFILGPAGEFAFVIVNEAMSRQLMTLEFAQGLLASAGLSLAMTPFMPTLSKLLIKILPLAKDEEAKPVLPASPHDTGSSDPHHGADVLVIGYGRVGRLVGEMLASHDIDFAAIDQDPVLVDRARKAGETIWFGDAAREDFLIASGIKTARALVVTMDQPEKVDKVVKVARALRPDLILIARARDDRHAARLYGLGVTDAVPETTEASLQLAENTLVDLGVPMGLVLATIHERRDAFRKVFQAANPDRERPTRAMPSRSKLRDRA